MLDTDCIDYTSWVTNMDRHSVVKAPMEEGGEQI